jgi:transcriptional regulator GlxA family with amidase domain
MVEEDDEGHDIAVQVARELALFLRRYGDNHNSVRCWIWIALRSHLSENCDSGYWAIRRNSFSVERLASRVAISPRNFARELGTTPARLVQQMRHEAARRRLEESKESVVQIASKCGFGQSGLDASGIRGALGNCTAYISRAFSDDRHQVAVKLIAYNLGLTKRNERSVIIDAL